MQLGNKYSNPRSNVILFGASGAGKSSVVNMLSRDENAAPISSGVEGCTFESQAYDVDIQGLPVTLWDTPGLNEGDKGRVPRADAIVQLYKLLLDLKQKGGVSLLVFVMRAPRITASAPANWKLFRDIICQGKVPSAIIVTGLEEAEDRQGWWWKHKGGFDKNDIKLSTIAGAECITACRGKARSGHVYDEEYEESRDQIRRLIRSTILDNPITVKPLEWFQTITENVKEWSWCSLSFQDVEVPFEEASEAAKQMGSLPGFTPDFVEELRQKMKKETE